jgi:hypothetical protein
VDRGWPHFARVRNRASEAPSAHSPGIRGYPGPCRSRIMAVTAVIADKESGGWIEAVPILRRVRSRASEAPRSEAARHEQDSMGRVAVI